MFLGVIFSENHEFDHDFYVPPIFMFSIFLPWSPLTPKTQIFEFFLNVLKTILIALTGIKTVKNVQLYCQNVKLF